MKFLYSLLATGVSCGVMNIAITRHYDKPWTRRPASGEMKVASEQVSVYDSYYVGAINVSSQTFDVIFDTGSNLMWIPGASCASDECGTQPLYTGPYTDTGATFSVQYADGSAYSGDIVSAPVSIGNISLASFNLGLVTDVTDPYFSTNQFSGLVGLAWDSLSQNGVTSLVPAFFSANQISLNLFSFYFPPDGDDGALLIGSVDAEQYALNGTITYLPLTLEAYWQIDLHAIAVGSNNETSSQAQVTAILDSGSSLIVGPPRDISNIVSAIEAFIGAPVGFDSESGLYWVDCSFANVLPAISFTLAGSDNLPHTFTMAGFALIVRDWSDGVTCPLGLQEWTPSSGVDWILGDVFLRQFYSVYDYTNSRVGLGIAMNASTRYEFNGAQQGVPPLAGVLISFMLLFSWL